MVPQRISNTRLPTLVFSTNADGSRYVAAQIADLIRQNNVRGKRTVLGLATGATPVGLYRELVRMHQEEKLDFSRVVTFNLDEYYPMTRSETQSYYLFMRETLFRHINIDPKNTHIPDGEVPREQIEDHCRQY